MNCFSEEQLSRISHLVREIEKLTDVEKLFLYLQLPCGRADTSDVNNKQSAQRFNGTTAVGIQRSLDLFSKKPDQETTQTYTWILSHLEIDPNVSLPKQEVYDEYRAFCQANRFEPLCVADFGKAMKHAFPCIKPRRLGQRGNSRYCYSGLRKKYKIQPPNLPDIGGCDEHQQQFMYCTMTNCDQTSNTLSSTGPTTTTTMSTANNNTNGTSRGSSSSSSSSNNSSSSSSSSNNNNNSDFNGNNMTIKNSTSSNTEYPLMSNKRPNYNRPEVMNLKIEPNTHTNHTSSTNSGATLQFNEDAASKQQQQQQQQVNYSFQLEDIGQRTNRPHHHQQQQQQLMATTSTASSYDNQALGHHLPQHSRYSDYSLRTIQQPGTPDDDDYQHNYQDMLPLSGHFLSSTTNIATLQPAHGSQTIPLTGINGDANFGYHQQPCGPMASGCVAAPAGTTTDDHNHSSMQPNDDKYLNSALSVTPAGPSLQVSLAGGSQTQPAPLRPTVQAGPASSLGASGNVHLINHHMGVTHMDACASPFQSPASTPYPTISSNYPIQDMMQDYCSSGCRLYQSS